jgi:hypothetical protein
MVVVPPDAERTAARYREARERAFTPPSLAQVISGLGEDAWGNGSGLSVLTRQGEYFTVGAQKCCGRSTPDQLVALARAVLDRLQWLSPLESMVSREGIEPSTRRLRDSPNPGPIAADLGKSGSALSRAGRLLRSCVTAAFSGRRCTSLYVVESTLQRDRDTGVTGRQQ